MRMVKIGPNGGQSSEKEDVKSPQGDCWEELTGVALRGVAKDLPADCATGIGQLSVEGGELRIGAEGEFEVGRVVGGEVVPSSNSEDFRSQIDRRLILCRKREGIEIRKKVCSGNSIRDLPSLSGQQSVRDLKKPETWY